MSGADLKIGFLIFPGFPMACLTSVIEPLRAANEISGTQRFSWALISEDGAKVISSAGVAFDADHALDNLPDLSHLLLLAAPTSPFEQARSTGVLRRLSRHGTVLGAISGGVFPLVRSGVVIDGPLSVHWCYETAFQAEFPQIEASSQVIERGGRIMSASGAAAAFDLALHLVETALDDTIATEVACWFQHPMMRKSGVAQSVPVLQQDGTARGEGSALVARASAIFAQHLADPIAVAEVAAQLNITPRHLERSFKKATGQNPSRYYRALRMKAARQIVMYSNDRIQDIAAAVGYGNAGLFSRHYRDAFGLTPKEDRNRINLYRVEGNLPVPSI
ncbi:MAG: helix-turn-helix domain-containing protein [Pelagimonas sp.]|jgi:transcriptional regulator GlxA family with amidase domain|nr:helix-turn-helix domain-containing protein [Pelagimonas sp.]